MSSWQDMLRTHVRREYRVIRDLVLIFVVSIVVGSYFLQRMDGEVHGVERQHLDALSHLTAQNSVEYLASGNGVNLGVIARQVAALDPVRGVAIRNLQGKLLASGGQPGNESAAITSGVRQDDGTPLGTVSLWAAPMTAPHRQMEDGFVVVMLILLMLRVLVEVIRRRLWPESRPVSAPEPERESIPPEPESAATNATASATAVLRVSIVNFDRMRARFTASLLADLVREYNGLLQRLASLYGARVDQDLGARACLVMTGTSVSEAAFSALCAGQLFLRASRRLSEKRKAAGHTPLEFKLLVSTETDEAATWSLCQAGLPGRVHVLDEELVQQELDTRVLYQPERCLAVAAGEQTLRLQPIEQLAQRYQKLVAAQADKLVPLPEGRGVPSPSR